MTPIQRCLTRITVIGLLLIGVIMALVVSVWGSAALQMGAQHLKPILLIWRGLLFVLLIGGWPVWIHMARTRDWITAEDSTRLLRYQWPFALWLLLLEAVLNQGLLLKLVVVILESD